MPTRRTAEPPAAARYDSLVLHVAANGADHLLGVSVVLARTFGARLIGVGAQRFETPVLAHPDGGFVTARVVEDLEALAQADLARAEEAFRVATAGLETEWRTARQAPAYAVSRAARDADLIVAVAAGGDAASAHHADAADLVMTSGRPVLVAPPGAVQLEARRIIVAWEDGREARRAVADALPLLLRAEEVLVQAVCGEDGRRPEMDAEVAAVAANLARRGVRARGEVAVTDAPPAEQLDISAAALGADLIVAGAYGHSRTSEWAFGGVTRDLLRDPRRFVLLSH